MQKLLSNQTNLQDLRIHFKTIDSTKNYQENIFDISFIREMIQSLKQLSTVSFTISNEKKIQLDLQFLDNTFQYMNNLQRVTLQIQGASNELTDGEDPFYIYLQDMKFMNKIFNQNTQIEQLKIFINTVHCDDLSPFQKTFSALEKLKTLNLNLVNNNKAKNYDFLETVFQNNKNLENLTITLKNGYFNKPLEKAFLNNTKLKKLWILLYENYSKDYNIFNSVLQPLYKTVDDLLYQEENDFLYTILRNYDLKYMKQQNYRLFFDENSSKAQKCDPNNFNAFNSPCQSCQQLQYECTSCLYNLINKNKECVCQSNFCQDKDSGYCIQSPNNDENCKICNKDKCIKCKDNYTKYESNICQKIKPYDDNQELVIALSIGGSILFLVFIGIIAFYIRKKKKQQQQQDNQDQEQQNSQTQQLIQ